MIPTKVPMAGKWIKVRWADLDGKFGDFDLDGLAIRLDRSLKKKPGEALDVLAHELSHASMELAGLAEVMEGEMEEAVARNFEYMLWPSLKWLTKKVDVS